MMRLSDLFRPPRVAPVEKYPDELLSALRSVARTARRASHRRADDARLYNSAYTSTHLAASSASNWSKAATSS